jgi:hypothetical protein
MSSTKEDHIDNLKMQGVSTLYMDEKMSVIDTLEAFGGNDAIDAIMTIMKSTGDTEVTKQGNEAIRRIRQSMK